MKKFLKIGEKSEKCSTKLVNSVKIVEKGGKNLGTNARQKYGNFFPGRVSGVRGAAASVQGLATSVQGPTASGHCTGPAASVQHKRPAFTACGQRSQLVASVHRAAASISTPRQPTAPSGSLPERCPAYTDAAMGVRQRAWTLPGA